MKADNKLERAYEFLTNTLSRPHGDEMFLLANVIFLLKESSDYLSTQELLLLAERTFDASQLSTVPLLTAERVDAVRTLLEHGISPNRFPELPAISPEDMKRALLTCDMDVFTDLIEAVALDNQGYYAPDETLSISDQLRKLGLFGTPYKDPEKETNTKIFYLYIDAENNKVRNECVIQGVLTPKQQQVILSCLDDSNYFIPSLVGLPEDKFEEIDDPDIDHQWFTLFKDSFSVTEKRADVSISADELVAAFCNCKGRWMDIYLEPSKEGNEQLFLGFRSDYNFHAHPERVCYVPENWDFDEGPGYTKQDFLNLCNGDEKKALILFEACDWQHPETVLDEWSREEEEFLDSVPGPFKKQQLSVETKLGYLIKDSLVDQSLSSPDPDVSTTKNLISAMVAYGLEFNWSDSEIIDALTDLGITYDDFRKVGAEDFAKPFLFDEASFPRGSMQGVWICVYKDTLGFPDDHDNLTEILVPTDWLMKELQSKGISPQKWFDEYTADDTDDISQKALSEGVILDCSNAEIKKSIINKPKALDEQIQAAAGRTADPRIISKNKTLMSSER